MSTATAAPLGTFDDVVEGPSGIEFKEVEAWGRTYGLLSITAGEALEWVEDRQDPKKAPSAGLRLLARSFVDRDRNRLCDTKDKEDRMVAVLHKKDSKTVNDLVTAVLQLNGILTATAAAAKND